MPSLSPEAIEILKEMHGKTELRFDSLEEAKAFDQKLWSMRNAQDKLELIYCVEHIRMIWDDEGPACWGLPISAYGIGATNALHAVGVI